MTNIKIAELQSDNLFEELSDEQVETVVGGSLLGDIGKTNQDIGNTGTPTSGLVGLLGTTVVLTGLYILKTDSGVEKGLQDVNQTVTNVTGN